MDDGCSAGGPGKDNLDPVEDVLNENPSLVALGKILFGVHAQAS